MESGVGIGFPVDIHTVADHVLKRFARFRSAFCQMQMEIKEFQPHDIVEILTVFLHGFRLQFRHDTSLLTC